MVKSDSDSSSESDSAIEAKKRMPEEDFLIYSETHSEKSCDISQLSDSVSHLSESEGGFFIDNIDKQNINRFLYLIWLFSFGHL